MKLKMIVCVKRINDKLLIGDKNPEGNGLLWHSKEELQFFKEKTIGNVVVFGENTAKHVPIKLIEKTREVEILTLDVNFDDILEKYKDTEKDIFICGGATIYKYILDNYQLDEIYVSELDNKVDVKESKNPLYFPSLENYGYKIVRGKKYNDFLSYVYVGQDKR